MLSYLALPVEGFFPSGSRTGLSPLHWHSSSPFTTWEPSACTSSSGSGLAVFAGSVPSLQLEPHRFLKCRQLWKRLMQCSFGPSPRSNDQAICLVDTVETHVREEDDGCKLDIRNGRSSNASEPSLQTMEIANWDSIHPTKSWPSRTIAFTSLVVWSTTL